MADGFYRFQQSGAGQFFQPQNHRQLNRTSSPPPAGRRNFNNDTPSPSRSPVSQSPAHNVFNMYNHGGHQGHNVMMNGGQHHQRFGMQIPKQHQHHPHQQQSHHQNQHTQAPHIGHHYNYSSGALSSATPHFGHSHLQNGNADSVQDEPEEALSEHWQQQAALADEARAAHSPHYYARHIARDQKGITFSTNATTTEDNRNEEKNRPVIQEPEPKRQDWMALDFGGQGLRALSDALFRYTFLEKLYLNYNQLKELPREIGTLKSLTHLDVSGNLLRTLPPEIGMLSNLQKLLITDNHIEQLPYELGYLYKLDTFGVYGNPMLPENLKSKIVESGTKGLLEYLLEEKPPAEKPEPREWLTVDETSTNQNVETVTAVTYNILCDLYCTKSQYRYTPSKYLSWDVRKQMILDEVREYDADIVCFQELDRWNYEDFFRSELSYNGYKGYYAQKSRADTMGDKARLVDGCGTFWKEKKYICLDQQHLVYGRKAVDRPGAKASADMLNRVWARDDIAVVNFLENRITGSRLIVANTHVFWDPAFKDVKLIQVAVLLEELAKLADKWAKFPPCTNKQVFRFSDDEENDGPQPTPGPSLKYDEGSQIPMILCCDLNSRLDSAVCDLLAQGGMPSKHTDLDDRNYGSFSADGIKHPFTLKSVYNGEMRFTNYTPSFVDVIDYIWYSANTLRLQKMLLGIDEHYVAKVPGFPNEHFPSDHIALKAEFAVTSKKKGQVVEADFGPGSSSRK